MSVRFAAVLLCVLPLLLACGGVRAASADGRPEYRVHVAPDLGTLTVHACFDAPVVLAPLDPAGRDYLKPGRLLPRGGSPSMLPPARTLAVPAGCVEYGFDLDRAARVQSDGHARRIGRDLASSPNLWLWLPDAARATGVDVVLDLPPGISASVPWPELGAPEAHRYRFLPGPEGWRPVVVFGDFSVRRVPVAGTVLRLAVLDGRPAADVDEMAAWLGGAAALLTGVVPSFPVAAPQVLVVPVAGSDRFRSRPGGSPVPFARVLRDGGTAAQFFVDQRASLERLRGDWTAAHEFSHMLLPFVDQDDGWISEGVASYYQNVLRARAGRITPRRAWQNLEAGFERGRRHDYTDTLHESIREGGANHTMRMYWTGAAVALLADVALRTRSHGAQSLDTVLAQLAGCCLPAQRAWGGEALFARLDELAGGHLFTDLYRRYADSTEFPELDDAWARLGIRFEGGTVELDDAPAARALRAGIMGGDDGSPPSR